MGLILQTKNHALQLESMKLQQLRSSHTEKMKELKESQASYLEGSRYLNEIRASDYRKNLATFEKSVTLAKEKWTQLYQELQSLELKLSIQIKRVASAQNDLKLVEITKEKYITQWKQHIGKVEQAQLDERFGQIVHKQREKSNG